MSSSSLSLILGHIVTSFRYAVWQKCDDYFFVCAQLLVKFWPHRMTFKVLVLQPGINWGPAVNMLNPNHWTPGNSSQSTVILWTQKDSCLECLSSKCLAETVIFWPPAEKMKLDSIWTTFGLMMFENPWSQKIFPNGHKLQNEVRYARERKYNLDCKAIEGRDGLGFSSKTLLWSR